MCAKEAKIKSKSRIPPPDIVTNSGQVPPPPQAQHCSAAMKPASSSTSLHCDGCASYHDEHVYDSYMAELSSFTQANVVWSVGGAVGAAVGAAVVGPGVGTVRQSVQPAYSVE